MLHYQSNWINLKDSGGDLMISPARVYSAKLGRFLSRDPLKSMVFIDRLMFYERSIFSLGLVKNIVAYNVNSKFYLSSIHKIETFNAFGENPTSFTDSFGLERFYRQDIPSHNKKGCCGLEIGKKLEELVNKVRTRLQQDPRRAKHVCKQIFSGDGWDIFELAFQKNLFQTKEGENPKCGYFPCDQTATVYGTCYKTHTINYILWGMLAQFCTVQKKIGIYTSLPILNVQANPSPEFPRPYSTEDSQMYTAAEVVIAYRIYRRWESLFKKGQRKRFGDPVEIEGRYIATIMGWRGKFKWEDLEAKYRSDNAIMYMKSRVSHCTPCSQPYENILTSRVGNDWYAMVTASSGKPYDNWQDHYTVIPEDYNELPDNLKENWKNYQDPYK